MPTSTALNFLAEPSKHRPLKGLQNFPPPLRLSHILSWHLMMASLPWWSDQCSVSPLRLSLNGAHLQIYFSSLPTLPGERPIWVSSVKLFSVPTQMASSGPLKQPDLSLVSCLLELFIFCSELCSLCPWELTQWIRGDSPLPVFRQLPWPNHFK